MKTYTLPTISGVLSDDYLYFEGINRPRSFYLLRDGVSVKDVGELESYFNDLYNLFLRKLTIFASTTPLSEEDTLKLQALLQELVKVKTLIENAGKVDIMER